MKDNKFLVLCALGAIWLLMFVAMLFGAKIHPRVEIMIYAICVGWFAYWTASTIWDYIRKGTPPTPVAPPTPTVTTKPNANSKKTPKSE